MENDFCFSKEKLTFFMTFVTQSLNSKIFSMNFFAFSTSVNLMMTLISSFLSSNFSMANSSSVTS